MRWRRWYGWECPDPNCDFKIRSTDKASVLLAVGQHAASVSQTATRSDRPPRVMTDGSTVTFTETINFSV